MKKQICCSFLSILISAMPALACYPEPEFVYDEMSSQTVSIATATVETVNLENSENSSCWTIRYSGAAYIFGLGRKEFSVTTCTDEVYQIEYLSEETEGLEYLGFIANAEVLAGLVQTSEDASEFRYAILSCWGPLHINLDKFSTTERAEFLRELEAEIISKQ